VKWSGEQISEEEGLAIHQWPPTRKVDIEGLGPVFFCHATPRNDTEIFTRETPEERLLPVFAGAAADLVVCGHTHMPFDRAVGGIRVVNAGSVGMPYGEPGAYWLLLGPGSPSGIEPRRTPYDLEAAAARIRATSYPQAEDFAERSILHPPPEAEMVARFEKLALR